ncbi:MAG: hypothetical protein ACOX41_10040 [Anaerovoracaceae bacterium]
MKKKISVILAVTLAMLLCLTSCSGSISYLDEGSWAKAQNYRFAIESAKLSGGDHYQAGTYLFRVTGAKDNEKRAPIVWNIYVTKTDTMEQEDLKKEELLAVVGGRSGKTADLKLEDGDYVYLEYAGAGGSGKRPSGTLEWKKQ